MAFTDALVDHADVHVTLVDRRHAAGGHWLDAYPFVQLHQASLFYGVASTVLGTGAVQTTGPETGPPPRRQKPRRAATVDPRTASRMAPTRRKGRLVGVLSAARYVGRSYCSGKRDGVSAGQAPSRIHWRLRSGRAIR